MSQTGISRRKFGRLMAGEAIASAGSLLGKQEIKRPRPNVVFLLADDVGYGDLACLGNPAIQTPNLDSLYQQSVRFTDFHVSPTCSPTRASIITGRYSDATGVWHTIMGRSLLDPRNTTLAQCFKSSGYATGIFGKWHLGDNYPCRPTDLGFDEAIVCGGGGIWQTPDYFGNDDRNDAYLHNGNYQKYLGFSTDVFFQRAIDFAAGAQAKQRPFLCYIPTPAAHEPTWALEADAAPYRNVAGLKQPGFYGMIANIDANLGRMRKFLEARGLAENTIVIYAGDNGSSDGAGVFNAGMRGNKGSPYEGGHRVPLFISWPAGGLKQGTDVSTLTAHIDILPTLVDLCGLKNRGANVDGVSLRPLLYPGQSAWPERTIVTDSQRQEHLVKWKDTAVMTQRWRLVNSTATGDETKLELYDIQQDPGQKFDLAARYPDLVQKLKAEYESWWKKASLVANEYVRIELGSDKENPSRLNCMDWHGNGSNLVWNQRQIRGAPTANGSWMVNINRAGRYRFQLRRWPQELDLPIESPYASRIPNMEKTPGVAISAERARLNIGNIDVAKPLQPRDKYVEFVVSLSSGPAELKTTFYGRDGTERGAYYVYIERLDSTPRRNLPASPSKVPRQGRHEAALYCSRPRGQDSGSKLNH
jgi:arylsulfatase A-like enzyme